MQTQPAVNVAEASLDDLDTIEGMVTKNPRILTTQILRWQLRHRETNGLALGVVRVGKYLLINQRFYAQWVVTGAGKAH